MADPRAYPVFDEIKENTKILKEAIEQIKQKVYKAEVYKNDSDAYKKAANVVFDHPRPATPLDPWSDPMAAAPTQELNQSYMDEEEDPFRLNNIFRDSYNRALQKLIKRKLNVNVRILDVTTQTEYQPYFDLDPFTSMNDTPSIGAPMFDSHLVIKLTALYPWNEYENIEIEMKFKRDLIFTNELNNQFPQLNDLELSQEAGIALRLALILGKIGKELQKLGDDFNEVAKWLGVNIDSYTTKIRYGNDW